MSENMIDRVAQAIYDAPNGIDGDQLADMILDDDRITGQSPVECRAQVLAVCQMAARAAIEAMREPTEEMLAIDRPDWVLSTPDGTLLQSWRAMIDSALAEKPR